MYLAEMELLRGHHLFAQANSLAVAVINDELALTAKANILFTRPVKENERVVAKAKVRQNRSMHQIARLLK